jgi:hypothetical protein
MRLFSFFLSLEKKMKLLLRIFFFPVLYPRNFCFIFQVIVLYFSRFYFSYVSFKQLKKTFWIFTRGDFSRFRKYYSFCNTGQGMASFLVDVLFFNFRAASLETAVTSGSLPLSVLRSNVIFRGVENLKCLDLRKDESLVFISLHSGLPVVSDVLSLLDYSLVQITTSKRHEHSKIKFIHVNKGTDITFSAVIFLKYLMKGFSGCYLIDSSSRQQNVVDFAFGMDFSTSRFLFDLIKKRSICFVPVQVVISPETQDNCFHAFLGSSFRLNALCSDPQDLLRKVLLVMENQFKDIALEYPCYKYQIRIDSIFFKEVF